MIELAASLTGISKRFGATLALDAVEFDVRRGEIHAVVGENGAGKSTLIRILGGVCQPDRGSIRVDGSEHHFPTPRDAIAAGVVTIPQELRLVAALSIAENIALGALPVRRLGPLTIVDRARMRAEARAVLAELAFDPDPDRPVGSLGFAERQLVAIAKALRRRCRIFILDEPTAALEQREIERLFALLQRMKGQGTAVVYISHQLDEVVNIADRCTVLRDGRVVAVSARGAFAVPDLVSAMTGRAAEAVAATPLVPGEVLLETPDDESAAHVPAQWPPVREEEHAPAKIRLRSREIVGLAGLLGSGAGRMLRRLFANPAEAIAAGIGMVPPERRLGLVMNQSVRNNILLPNLHALRRIGMLDGKAGDRIVAEVMEALDIRPRRPALPARALSGGNQQKVIVAKWLARRVAVLLLDEPTQGVDVAAKAQIHALIRDFAARGGGALIHSSDLAELTRLCDRVLAVRHGRIAATLDRAARVDEPALRAAIGG